MNLAEEWMIVPALLLGILFIIVIVRSLKGNDVLPTLVLQEYRASSRPQDGLYVVIRGRREGFWSMIFSALGLGTSVRFEVSRSAVAREMRNPNWQNLDSVPISNLSSTSFGYTRDLLYLLYAAVLIIGGFCGLVLAINGEANPDKDAVVAVLIGAMLFGLLFILAYFLSQRLMIQIETAGGRTLGIRFQPSVVGQITVNRAEAARTVEIINALIAEQSTIPAPRGSSAAPSISPQS